MVGAPRGKEGDAALPDRNKRAAGQKRQRARAYHRIDKKCLRFEQKAQKFIHELNKFIDKLHFSLDCFQKKVYTGIVKRKRFQKRFQSIGKL